LRKSPLRITSLRLSERDETELPEGKKREREREREREFLIARADFAAEFG